MGFTEKFSMMDTITLENTLMVNTKALRKSFVQMENWYCINNILMV